MFPQGVVPSVTELSGLGFGGDVDGTAPIVMGVELAVSETVDVSVVSVVVL